MNCSQPKYIIISPDEREGREGKKKVTFINPSSYDYSSDFRNNVLLKGAIEIPCGQCLACRINYSKVWADRCYLESLCHEHTWFITLSIRDECLKYGKLGLPTLEKDAITKFMKKLRNAYRDTPGIRFFGCGEYGDGKGERAGFNPHYHIIVFGAPIDDLTIDMPDMTKDLLPSGKYPIFRRKNSNGDYVFWSKTIYDCWQKGKIEVEEASWNCAAYVSRYVLKKQKGKGKEIYQRLDIIPEYIRMSNRPGIGADWLLGNKEKLLLFDYLSVKNLKGVETHHPPRYFEKLMMKDPDSVDAALMEANKIGRIVNSRNKCNESISKKSVGDQYRLSDENLQKKIKLLKRDIT